MNDVGDRGRAVVYTHVYTRVERSESRKEKRARNIDDDYIYTGPPTPLRPYRKWRPVMSGNVLYALHTYIIWLAFSHQCLHHLYYHQHHHNPSNDQQTVVTFRMLFELLLINSIIILSDKFEIICFNNIFNEQIQNFINNHMNTYYFPSKLCIDYRYTNTNTIISYKLGYYKIKSTCILFNMIPLIISNM